MRFLAYEHYLFIHIFTEINSEDRDDEVGKAENTYYNFKPMDRPNVSSSKTRIAVEELSNYVRINFCKEYCFKEQFLVICVLFDGLLFLLPA